MQEKKRKIFCFVSGAGGNNVVFFLIFLQFMFV